MNKSLYIHGKNSHQFPRNSSITQLIGTYVHLVLAGEPTRDGISLSFPLAMDRPESALVESAALRLLLDHDENNLTGELDIRIYRRRASGARRRLLSRRLVREPETLRRRWLEFDLTDEVAAATSLDAGAPFHLLVQVLSKVGSCLYSRYSCRTLARAQCLHVLFFFEPILEYSGIRAAIGFFGLLTGC